MNFSRLSTLLLLPLLIASCATMNKNECLTADWQAIGYQDGKQGYQDSYRFGQHSKACSKHGIAANFSQYKIGYDQGVRQYCTPQKGFELGKHNKGIPNICPNDLVAGMRRGYDAGHDIYLRKQPLQEEISALGQTIDTLSNEVDTIESESAEHQEYLDLANAELRKPNISNAQKVIFYNEKIQLQERIRANDYEVGEIELEIERFNEKILELRERIHYLDATPPPRF